MVALSASRDGSYISPRAELGSRVRIGAGVQLFGKVIVGDDVIIDANVTLGYPCASTIRKRLPEGRFASAEELLDDAVSETTEIGTGAILRRFCVIYEGVKTGPGLDCAHHVTIREHCDLGRGVELGPFTYIKRDCQVGDHSRIAGELCDRTIVGRYCTVFGRTVHKFYAGISGLKEESPRLEDGVVIGREACIVGPIIVDRLSLVGAGSVVTRSVDQKLVVVGNPARVLREREREEAVDLWEKVESLKQNLGRCAP
jgi:serine acetyltransferase